MSVDPRYPIGPFWEPQTVTAGQREAWLGDIEALPGLLREAVSGLTEAQLDQPYREGGWTIRQLVHHLADSHMHSYLRCKFAQTMENPTITPYDEAVWALMADAASAPVELSLRLIECLHARWCRWFRSLEEKDFDRTLLHPESGQLTLSTMLALYAWHGRHHLAHIRNAPRK